MLHLFALIHANFAQLMYHCSFEGSHWRFNYLLDFVVCVCACVVLLAYDGCVDIVKDCLWILLHYMQLYLYQLASTIIKCLYVCASVCECLSARGLNP